MDSPLSEFGPTRLSPGSLTGRAVLVAGGAGAVGHAAIQLARWAGAEVITTVSGPAKAELARGHVEFYSQPSTNNSQLTLLSSVTNPPFNFTWSNVSTGSYTLTARAIDLYGPVATSAPVNIS